MALRESNCLVCGKPLVYLQRAEPMTCHICGASGTSSVACEDGHYICDSCHRRQGAEYAIAECLRLDSRDPAWIADHLMGHPSIYANGPEHHTLVGAALMCAYANAGGDVDLPSALDELFRRSMMVPGGACGYWGCCGAATSAGQFYSIVSKSTPLAGEAWGATARLTSLVLGRIADFGGPRCCKRTGFLAIQVTVPYVEQTLGVRMELPERITCRHFPRNAQCLRDRCPFFPEGATHPDDR